MVLHSASFEGTRISSEIVKVLNKREDQWNENQRKLLSLKVEEKIKKAMNASNYTKKLLMDCKSWRGPCVSSEELLLVLNDFSDLQEKIVRTELAYYRDTHKPEVTASPELFKLCTITHEERLMNLCALLDGCPVSTKVCLPSNEDALKAISRIPEVEEIVESPIALNVYQMCIVLWTVNGKRKWFLGYCTKVLDDGRYEIEHLERVSEKKNLKWRYPTQDDKQNIDADQILDCEISGDWDVLLSDRNMHFTLQNHKEIAAKFEEIL